MSTAILETIHFLRWRAKVALALILLSGVLQGLLTRSSAQVVAGIELILGIMVIVNGYWLVEARSHKIAGLHIYWVAFVINMTIILGSGILSALISLLRFSVDESLEKVAFVMLGNVLLTNLFLMLASPKTKSDWDELKRHVKTYSDT